MRREPHTEQETKPGSVLRYTVGFVLSIILTLLAFYVVMHQPLAPTLLIAAVLTLAAAQLFVQLTCFLHLGTEPRPRWNLIVFSFMLLVLFIIVLGSLWIMKNLDYHMPHPERLDHHIMQDEGIYRE